MVRDPRFLKSQRSGPDAAVWPLVPDVPLSTAQRSEKGVREAPLWASIRTTAPSPTPVPFPREGWLRKLPEPRYLRLAHIEKGLAFRDTGYLPL